jgi:hypothetical protein
MILSQLNLYINNITPLCKLIAEYAEPCCPSCGKIRKYNDNLCLLCKGKQNLPLICTSCAIDGLYNSISGAHLVAFISKESIFYTTLHYGCFMERDPTKLISAPHNKLKCKTCNKNITLIGECGTYGCYDCVSYKNKPMILASSDSIPSNKLILFTEKMDESYEDIIDKIRIKGDIRCLLPIIIILCIIFFLIVIVCIIPRLIL